MYCFNCSFKLKFGYHFCPNCGLKTKIDDEEDEVLNLEKDFPSQLSAEKAQSSQSDHQSFQKFKKFKSAKTSERTSFNLFRNKSSKKQCNQVVQVNVGLGISKRCHDKTIPISFKSIRGKTLPVKVNSLSNVNELIDAAVNKHTKYNNDFNCENEYELFYPDGTLVSELPGSKITFNLKEYKDDLGKPYGKITFFLAPKLSEATTFTLCNSDTDDETLPTFTNNHLLMDTASGKENSIAEACTSTKSSTYITSTLLRCPICNKQVANAILNSHANMCLDALKTKTPYLGEIFDKVESNSECETESDNNQHENIDEITAEIDKSVKISAIEIALRAAKINRSEDQVQIKVRRGYSFKDFWSFFKKPWNKSKQQNEYLFSYIGEAGYDTGGVSREFYSGK